MKLTIKVWCLPGDLTESELQSLFWTIVASVKSIEELGVKSEKDVLVLFPTDRMEFGLGEEILAEISGGDFPFQERTEEVKSQLIASVGEVIQKRFPNAEVSVDFPRPFRL